MSRAKLFNMVKSRGEKPVGRNPFDLTNRHVYSQKAAKITPIKALHTYPDDFFDISVSEFTQNKVPMNTAAFLSGKKELLAYFVPYNTIWHNYNQYQATREDPESTLLYNQGIAYEPRMRVYDLYIRAFQFVFGSWLFNKYLDVYAILRYHATRPTIEQGITIPELITYMKENEFQASGHTIWEEYRNIAFTMSKSLSVDDYNNGLHALGLDFYRLFFKHDKSYSEYKLFDCVTNMFGNHVWCDYIQKLDMLGYGNLYPIFHGMLLTIDKYVDDAILTNSNSECVVSGNITYTYKGVSTVLNIDFNLFDDLAAVDNDYFFHDLLNPYYVKLVNMSTNGYDDDDRPIYEFLNVYSIFAYNKCFYDYFRNPYFDTDYSPYNYNCDFISGSSLEGSIINLNDLPLRWFHLECHQWKKDMFTGVLPDNQLGQVSELILNGVGHVSGYTETTNQFAKNYNLDDTPNPSADGAVAISNGHNLVDSDGVGTLHRHSLSDSRVNITTSAELNVLALKRAEAIQQYRQDLMRAGNRTNDIFQQIYGSTPKSQLEESPYFIEVVSNDINVNPIISTAQTGDGTNQSLGDIAARVTISGSDLHFKFSTKDFGVIIFLSHIVPDSFYNSYRIDPFNMHLDQESHGLPYFQNLGLQPVIGSMLSNYGSADNRSRILGFAPPYIEFKTDIDLVHGDFVDLFQPRVNAADTDTDYQGEMSHWVVARTDMQQEDAVSLRNFYIDPRILDNVFTFNAGDDYSTDHFFTYSVLKVNAVRAFSELGLPRF